MWIHTRNRLASAGRLSSVLLRHRRTSSSTTGATRTTRCTTHSRRTRTSTRRAMLTTTRRGIQYPDPVNRTDRADIALHISYAALAADVDVLFNQGTDAARQAAAHQAGGGRFWWTTDTKIMWYDDGATWATVGSIAPGAITSLLIADGTIQDVDIAANAGIMISKLAGYPGDPSRVLYGNGSWAIPTIYPVNTRPGSYTLSLGDSNGLVEMNSGAANTVTIPNDGTASFPLGSQITIAQIGGGQTNIAGAGGNLVP